jgi:hypothetical protein
MSKYLDQVIARMISEGADDVSDASIDAALKDCIGGRKFTDLAKRYRDDGLLSTPDIQQANG